MKLRLFIILFVSPAAYIPFIGHDGEFAKLFFFYFLFGAFIIFNFREIRDSLKVIPKKFYLLLSFLGWSAVCAYASRLPFNGLGFLIFWTSNFAIFLISYSIAERIDLFKITAVSVVTASFISIIGLLQYCGISIPGVGEVSGPASLFNNRNYAAHYLALVFPLSIALVFAERAKDHAYYWAGACFIQFTYILATRTRGVWVSLILSLLGLLLFLSLSGYVRQFLRQLAETGNFRKKTVFLILLLFAGLILNLVVTSRSAQASRDTDVVQRFGSLVDTKHGSIAIRIALLANSLEIIKDNPWTGIGPNNFAYVYGRYSEKKYPTPVYDYSVLYDHPHNEFISIAVENGLIGLLLILGFFILVFRNLWLHFRKIESPKENTVLHIGLLGGVIAILIYANFEFPLTSKASGILFWVFLGILLGLTRQKTVLIAGHIKPLFFVLIVPIILQFIISIANIRGGYNLIRFLEVREESGCRTAMPYYQDALKYLVFEPVSKLQFFSTFVRCNQGNPVLLPSLLRAYEVIPDYPKLWAYIVILAIEQGDMATAQKFTELFLKHQPGVGYGHFANGVLLGHAGNKAAAEQSFAKATELMPALGSLITDYRSGVRYFGHMRP